jgi:hypothetical protein
LLKLSQSLRKIFNEAVEIADARQRADYLASLFVGAGLVEADSELIQ